MRQDDIGLLRLDLASESRRVEDWKASCEAAEAEVAKLRAQLKPSFDISRMTLGELEATADRLGKAVATIREAQGLLGAPAKATRTVRAEVQPPDDEEEVPPRPEVAPDAVAAHRARQFQPPDEHVPRELQMPKRPRMSASEQMQRAALLGQFSKPAVDPNLPDDIAAAEQGEPPR